jgi:flagellar secretion chaperone FliS
VAYPSSAFEYRKSAVTGASPIQVIVLLYDGALRHMEAGRHAIAHQDYSRQNDHLQHAQRILMELMACLDLDRGGEIAWNLLQLYQYCLDELVRANIEDDAAGVSHAIRIFSDLRESWVQLQDCADTEIAIAA